MKVDEPIKDSLIAKTHPSLVLNHKYWARKPINVIREYIKHFTNEGDLICDPFTGSGITNIASLELKRKTIGIDLNPIAIFITRMTACHANISKIEEEFKKLEEEVKPQINKLYEVKCNTCDNNAIISHVIIERKYTLTKDGKNHLEENKEDEKRNKILSILKSKKDFVFYTYLKQVLEMKSVSLTKLMNELLDKGYITFEDSPIEFKYSCEKCKDKKFHKFNDSVKKQLDKKFNSINFKWYPKDRLYHNSRICAYKNMKIADFFTQRNLKALSLLLEGIEKIKNKELRDLMRFTFSSSLPQSSNLVFVIEQRGRTSGKIERTKEVGSWTLPSFTIMPKHFEVNVWNCFNERIEKIKRSKEEANYEIPIFEELPEKELTEYVKLTESLPTDNPEKIKYFDNLFHKYNLAIIWSALDLGFIPNNSIDYIFTDPPYGDSIPYLELSLFFNSWLYYKGKYPEFKPDYDEEIIVSDSDERENKDIEGYKELLKIAFKELNRILKPNAWISLTFHNRDIETWNALIVSAQESGLTYINDIYQVPPRASAKSGLAKSGSMTGDMIVNFRKIEDKNIIRTVSDEDIEKIIVKEAESLLGERYGKATEDQLMRGIIHILLRNQLTREIKNPTNYIQKVLSKHFDKKKDFWQLRTQIDKEKIISLDERIENLIRGVISKRNGSTFDEILARLFTNLKNGHTPESSDILKVLHRIAEVKKDRWILKGQKQLFSGESISPKEIKKKEQIQKEMTRHNKCIEILAKLAEILKISKSIGHTELIKNEQLRQYHDTLNKTGIPIDSLNEIREIDMIFSKSSVIKSCFEIEFSTLKTEKFLSRFRTLIQVTPNMKIPLFVVITPESEKQIVKILSKRGNQDITKHIRYISDSDLFTLYENALNKKIKLEFDHFFKISKRVEKQKELE